MSVFVPICVVIALATLIWLLRPLLSAAPGADDQETDNDHQDVNRSAQNLLIARERLDDLDTLHTNGDINQDEYIRQRDDIERALAAQINPHEQTGTQPRAFVLGAILIIAIPSLSAWLYSVTGTPEAMDPVHQLASQQPTTREDIEAMVNGLAQRMADDPDNSQGWYRLAQSYTVLGRYPEAVNAMQNIRRIEGETSDVLSMFSQAYMVMGRYDDAVETITKLRSKEGDTVENLLRHADALAMQQGARLTGEPETLIVAALDQEPSNIRALWMAGMAARQRGDNENALAHWTTLKPLLSEQPQNLAELTSLIEETQAAVGNGNAGAITETDAATSQSASVSVSVSLEDRLRASAQPDDVVFIFARAAKGPRMPLAAHKTTVGALPLTITLSDADAMTPQMTLSLFDEVQVVARVSKQGQPVAAPGDYEGTSGVINVKSNPSIVLVIDEILK